jgi:hypothetical protein
MAGLHGHLEPLSHDAHERIPERRRCDGLNTRVPSCVSKCKVSILSISSIRIKPHQEAIGTEAPEQVDYLYWVSAIQGADEISPA